MRKKVFSILLTLAMLLSLIPTAALAADVVAVVADTSAVTTVKPGDEITIPINITANAGITALDIAVSVDNSLEFVSMEAGTLLSGAIASEDASMRCNWFSTTASTATGTFFTVTLKVKESAAEGTATIRLTDHGTANSDYEEVSSTLTPGSIKIEYETAGVNMANGTQTGIDFAWAQQEALGASGYSLTTPDSTNTYYFAGWFSGLSDELKNDNGFYVIAPIEDTTTFAGAELRPRYDKPENGTYNALWIQGDSANSYVLTVGETNTVYCGTDDNTLFAAAIGGAAGAARTKLVKDMSLNAAVEASDPVHLDMNGCSITSTSTILNLGHSYSTGTKVDSGRAGGLINSGSSITINSSDGLESFGLIEEIRDITIRANNRLVGSHVKELRNCTLISTNGYEVVWTDENIIIDNCTIETKNKVASLANGATATLTNTTVTSDGTSALFVGQNDMSAGIIGAVILGVGNSFTAAKAANLFQMLAEVEFTTTDGIYQVKDGGTLFHSNISTVTVPEGNAYQVQNGRLYIGPQYTVTYKSWDGATDIDTKTVVAGCAADLSVTVDYGAEYSHTGWAAQQNGTALTAYTPTGNVTLYALRGEKGVSINGAEVTSTDPEVTIEDTAEITNAKKLGDLNSLTIVSEASDVTLKFSATALDSIAGLVSSTAQISIAAADSTTLGGAVARYELNVTGDDGSAVTFAGAVEVTVPFTPADGVGSNKYRVYHVADDGTKTAMPTSVSGDADSGYLAKFTTTHFSGFEVVETSVANGYTAGLSTTATEVNAGGKELAVYAGVSHSDANETGFNAAEVVVSYDASLLILDPDNLDSVENLKYTNENGVLTIEHFGEDKNFGTGVYTLNFTTCDSVDSSVNTTITLTRAAFIDKEGATENDLIDAALDPVSVTVTINKEAFDVTLEDSNITGAEEALKGEDYTFNVAEPDNYTYDFVVTVNGTPLADGVLVNNGDGSYTIPGEYVTGDIEVTYERTPNSYTVTFEGTGGSDVSGAANTATYGTAYTFTMPTLAKYQYTLSSVTINGSVYTGYTVEGGVVTIPGGDITGAIVITIGKEQTQFTVTLDGNGAGDAAATDGAGESTFDKGDDVKVTITPTPGYTYKVEAKDAAGSTLTVTDSGDNTYTIANITSDITVTVTRTLTGTVTIEEYLTLNADNSDSSSSSVFLVTYAGELADGYIPYCNDTAMYWSEKYSAYCYLVIDETLATAKENTAVVVKAGTKTPITYHNDVNGSGKTDAADAQLVYNMYTAEYADFSIVSVLKFLLADVNGDRTVNVSDAASIISAILGVS